MNLTDLGQTESNQTKTESSQDKEQRWAPSELVVSRSHLRKQTGKCLLTETVSICLSAPVCFIWVAESLHLMGLMGTLTQACDKVSRMCREHSSLEQSLQAPGLSLAPGDPSDTDTLGSTALRAGHTWRWSCQTAADKRLKHVYQVHQPRSWYTKQGR